MTTIKIEEMYGKINRDGNVNCHNVNGKIVSREEVMHLPVSPIDNISPNRNLLTISREDAEKLGMTIEHEYTHVGLSPLWGKVFFLHEKHDVFSTEKPTGLFDTVVIPIEECPPQFARRIGENSIANGVSIVPIDKEKAQYLQWYDINDVLSLTLLDGVPVPQEWLDAVAPTTMTSRGRVVDYANWPRALQQFPKDIPVGTLEFLKKDRAKA